MLGRHVVIERQLARLSLPDEHDAAQLLRRELGVSRGRRVDDERLHIRDVGQQGEDLQRVDEREGLLLPAPDVEGEDAAAAVGEILLIEGVVRVVRQCIGK